MPQAACLLQVFQQEKKAHAGKSFEQKAEAILRRIAAGPASAVEVINYKRLDFCPIVVFVLSSQFSGSLILRQM